MYNISDKTTNSTATVNPLIQLVKTDGIQGLQFGNQKKIQETGAWQRRSIAR